jgi:hypothetical protein
MTTYLWRRLTVDERTRIHAHALPDGYGPRSTALCGRTPTRGARWVAGDGTLLPLCKKCERQTHVRRLVREI